MDTECGRKRERVKLENKNNVWDKKDTLLNADVTEATTTNKRTMKDQRMPSQKSTIFESVETDVNLRQ